MALIMVLVFLTVMGLLMSALLAKGDASLKTTSVVRERTEMRDSADAGVKAGIEHVALNPNLCGSGAGSSSAIDAAEVEINGYTPEVTCEAVSGMAGGFGGWAIVATRNLVKQSGGDTKVTGPVWVDGSFDFVGVGGSLTVSRGNVWHNNAGCTGQPGELTVEPSPPYGFGCTSGATPSLAIVLPPVPAPAPAPVDLPGDCRVFSPGRYTAAPALGDRNYFASGVYYFDNVGLISVPNNTEIVGGTPRVPEWEPTPFDPALSACGADGDATGANGFGVEWIFGGNSAMAVNNNTGVELFGRYVDEELFDAEDYTERISFVAVPATANGYTESNSGIGCGGTAGNECVLNVTTGGAGFASHGMVFAPGADIALFASNGTVAQAQNGVVANDLVLQASAVGTGLVISVEPSEAVRYTIVTAVVNPTDSGSPVTTRAVVQLRDDIARSAYVESWRTG